MKTKERNWGNGTKGRAMDVLNHDLCKPFDLALPYQKPLETVLLNVFSGDMERGMERTFSNFADDTKLSGAVDTSEA